MFPQATPWINHFQSSAIPPPRSETNYPRRRSSSITMNIPKFSSHRSSNYQFKREEGLLWSLSQDIHSRLTYTDIPGAQMQLPRSLRVINFFCPREREKLVRRKIQCRRSEGGKGRLISAAPSRIYTRAINQVSSKLSQTEGLSRARAWIKQSPGTRSY